MQVHVVVFDVFHHCLLRQDLLNNLLAIVISASAEIGKKHKLFFQVVDNISQILHCGLVVVCQKIVYLPLRPVLLLYWQRFVQSHKVNWFAVMVFFCHFV